MLILFDKVDAAIASLKKALQAPPANDLERDGVIQRFEYSFEAIWKVGKRVLAKMGVTSTSPRAVIRDLAQQGLLADPRSWMLFLEARNYTSHTYDEATAQWVFSQSGPFLQAAEELLKALKTEVTR